MRRITVDYTKPIPCGMKNAGRIGEHNATELIIIPPALLSTNEKISHYIIAFAVECKVIHSKPISKMDELKIPLWKQLTQSEFLTVQLEGYDSEREFIGKSEPVRLRFLHSVCGEDVPADTDNHDFISDYLKNRHTHSNKDVLDNFAQDESGNPLYNGRVIGGSGLTEEQVTQLNENTFARHTHSNKESVLDKFALNERGELLFDGKPIKAEGIVESIDPRATMAQTVALLLEQDKIVEISLESPNAASLSTSDFAKKIEDIWQYNYTLLYVPSEDGTLKYITPVFGEEVELAVNAGGIYEFVCNLEYETNYKPYFGELVLEFFKSKILADCVTEENVDEKIQQIIRNGNFASKDDLVNYRRTNQQVPANEVGYSNPILEDKSGTIKGALDEAVDYVTTAIPTIQEAVDGKQPKGEYVTVSALNEKLSAISGISIEVVDVLPEEGINASTIYLVPSSVNAIKASLDIYEEDIYNGKGYAENTSYIPAFGEDAEKEGVCITGYIPIVGNDAITLKNIEYNRDNADNKIYILAYAGATPVTPTADELTTNYEAEWDNKGNLVSFKLPSNIGSNKYLRIQASYIGEDSSVVINEAEGNLYTEYIYVNETWECLGGQSVDVDLSNYYTKKEIDEKGFITAEDLPESDFSQFVEKLADGVNQYEPQTEGWTDDGYIVSSGEVKVNTTSYKSYAVTPAIPVKGGTTYTVKPIFNTVTSIADKSKARTYDSTGAALSEMVLTVNEDSVTFTTPKNSETIRFTVQAKVFGGREVVDANDIETVINTFNSSFMLVEGTEAPEEYEPFGNSGYKLKDIALPDKSVNLESVSDEALPIFASLAGKKIANFGDSIFGNARPPKDVSTFLAEKTGAEVLNCAFGGCRMGVHTGHWDAFSMYRLAYAIANNDYSLQDDALNYDDRVSYAETPLALIKSTDFSTVDILTIGYGTNDFTGGNALDNEENSLDTSTLAGALRYSIETLLTAYPNLRIFIVSATYRFWKDENNEFIEDSKTYLNKHNKTLPEYNAKLKEVAEEYNLPFIDNYNIGIGKFNRYQYFPVTDGTHHQLEGRKLIASHLAKELY